MVIKEPLIQQLFALVPNPEHNKPKVHNRHHRTAPADAVYIGRGSPWGNPFRIGDFWRERGRNMTREDVIERYRIHVLPTLNLAPLKGKHLLCYCKPAACHGDLLLKSANE